MNLKQSPRFGLWVFIGAIPLIVLSLYPAILHYLGYYKEHHALFHNNYKMSPYVALLFIAMFLPFAVFIILRIATRRKIRKVLKTGMNATARIISITPNGKKMKEGINEYWGADLELEVIITGKEPYRALVEHYIHVMDIPRFQTDGVLQVKINTAGNNEIIIL